ncbi:MerR family transcriptional regulator [Bifidobacterium moukalabense]|uniref:MerR family transcriptional regulator n=1 Tax=Bifidobacterium moukalabense TaxID=1333651 RepID=UPI0010F433C9|nr:MerR family transcriptional regulator [Bifidobacterium moukalabense]
MGADDELLTIGEVARLDGITTKALRYYDAHGILKPAAVDPVTGYRYYTPDQMLDVDVMRICVSSGIPLESLERYRFEDGSLDWRSVLEAAQSQVDNRIKQLRYLQTTISDYAGELVRKAHSPADGVVRSDLLPTWLAATDWPIDSPCDMKRYLRTMTALRTAIHDASAPYLLRRGILVDLERRRAYAFHQFAPSQRMLDIFHSGDRSQVVCDCDFPGDVTVINPPGGPAESQVIERDSLARCFDDGMTTAQALTPEDWPHVTMTEIWGSHAPDGSVRIRLTRHRCTPLYALQP